MSLVTGISPPAAIPAVASPASREERQHALRVDQIVHATVAEGGAERVLLDLGHRQLWAQSRIPLRAGQKLDLLVLATTPQVELRIVEDPLAGRLRQALHFLGLSREWPRLWHSLTAEPAPAASLPAEARRAVDEFSRLLVRPVPDGAGLRQLPRLLGLDAEAALARGEAVSAGVKSALLAMAEEVQGGEGAEDARRLLQGLEMLQLCRARLAREGGTFVPLPLPFLEQGYLLAEQKRQSAQDEPEQPPATSLCLHLQLRGMGSVRVDLLRDAQGLWVRFSCQSVDRAAFAASFRGEIEEGLAPFSLRHLSFTGGAEDPNRALVRRLLPEEEGVFDARG